MVNFLPLQLLPGRQLHLNPMSQLGELAKMRACQADLADTKVPCLGCLSVGQSIISGSLVEPLKLELSLSFVRRLSWATLGTSDRMQVRWICVPRCCPSANFGRTLFHLSRRDETRRDEPLSYEMLPLATTGRPASSSQLSHLLLLCESFNLSDINNDKIL